MVSLDFEKQWTNKQAVDAKCSLRVDARARRTYFKWTWKCAAIRSDSIVLFN